MSTKVKKQFQKPLLFNKEWQIIPENITFCLGIPFFVMAVCYRSLF